MITFASVCSGIEAASVAWEPLGWKCLWLAEIDKAASAVLAHHYPDVPNLGDLVTLADRMMAGEMPPPDVLIGGTPCQTFSVAGLRAGMSDPRGALTLAFVRLVNAIDDRRRALGLPPVIVVWENVPGVLTHKENPFGCFIGALAGENVSLLPSGRRWTHAGLVSGPERTAAWRVLDAQYFGLAQRRKRPFVVASADFGTDPGAILFESGGVRWDSPPGRATGPEIAGTAGAGVDGGGVPGSFAVTTSPTLRAAKNKTGGDRPPGTDVDTAETLVVVPFDTTQISSPDNYSHPKSGDPCHPLAAAAHPPAIAYGFQPRIARNGRGDTGEIVNALTAQAGLTGKGDAAPHVAVAMRVRRLVPIECERLQGFPDHHTAVAAGPKGPKLQADGPRYSQLGNSMPIPVINWLGVRIQQFRGSMAA